MRGKIGKGNIKSQVLEKKLSAQEHQVFETEFST